MTPAWLTSCTAFDGHRRIACGSLLEVALAVKVAALRGVAGAVLVFDDASGQQIDIDTRGSPRDVLDRLAATAGPSPDEASREEPPAAGDAPDNVAPRGRGRPRLGVVAREVTLLPRHWDWLSTQSGGASVALRKLVDAARRSTAERDAMRRTQESAYRFMSALAGDLPGFEEASRALFAGDLARMGSFVASWPNDVREHVLRMASPG